MSAASVNHGLRPDADHDVAVAGRLAAELNVPFAAIHITVPPGASRQAQARAARYRALAQCAVDCGADRIAVGHTQDDQAETVLARVLRGPSIEGLSAIAPRRRDGVVRPLLDAPRALARAYVASLGIEHVLDPSNHDPHYARVRIREQILPLLQRENPQLCEQLAYLADDARQLAERLQREADALVTQAKSDIDVLRSVSGPERRRALKRWAEAQTGASLHRQHIVALERMLSGRGEVRLPGGVLARLDGKALCFVPITKRGRG